MPRRHLTLLLAILVLATGGTFAAGASLLPWLSPCGNGIRDKSEQCDDGNQRSGDGCSKRCRNEADVHISIPKKAFAEGSAKVLVELGNNGPATAKMVTFTVLTSRNGTVTPLEGPCVKSSSYSASCTYDTLPRQETRVPFRVSAKATSCPIPLRLWVSVSPAATDDTNARNNVASLSLSIPCGDPLKSCEKMETGSRRDECFRDLALERSDVGLCMRAGTYASVCINALAYLSKNSTLCEYIPASSTDVTPVSCKKYLRASLNPKTEKDCLAQKGDWGILGLAQEPSCNMRTKDGGMSCTDSSQCEGTCYLPESMQAGTCLAVDDSCNHCAENGGKCVEDRKEGWKCSKPIPLSDGGKPCKSNNDCKGGCVFPELGSGICSGHFGTVGCIRLVRNGKIEPIICID